METEVAVIGGGLAGLSCAVTLREHGIASQVIDAADDIGGLVRTDMAIVENRAKRTSAAQLVSNL